MRSGRTSDRFDETSDQPSFDVPPFWCNIRPPRCNVSRPRWTVLPIKSLGFRILSGSCVLDISTLVSACFPPHRSPVSHLFRPPITRHQSEFTIHAPGLRPIPHSAFPLAQHSTTPALQHSISPSLRRPEQPAKTQSFPCVHTTLFRRRFVRRCKDYRTDPFDR
jgi:hypothetical protein